MGDNLIANTMPEDHHIVANSIPAALVLDAIFFAFSVAYLVAAQSYSGSERLFPTAIGYPTAIVVTTLFVRDTRRLLVARHRPARGRAKTLLSFNPLFCLLIAATYLAVLPILGFILTNILIGPGGALVLGAGLRRAIFTLLAAAVFTGLIEILFHMGSGVLLPSGKV